MKLDNQLAGAVFSTVLAPVPPPKTVAAESGQYLMTSLRHVSPKLNQIGRQLTECQLSNKLNSSFRFTNMLR